MNLTDLCSKIRVLFHSCEGIRVMVGKNHIYTLILFLTGLLAPCLSQAQSWTTYDKTNSGIPSNNIYSIQENTQGDLWIGSTKALSKFDSNGWTVYKKSNSPLPAKRINAIALDKSGNKWVATNGGGLAKFDGSNWSFFKASNSGLPDDDVEALAIDNTGNKWIGTEGGLAEYDGSNWTIYNSSNNQLPDDEVKNIVIDGQGNKWIGTDGGLAEYDGTKWTSYTTSNSGIPDDEVEALAVDNKGNIWVGNDGEGFAKFDHSNWTNYKKGNSALPHNNIKALGVDQNGVVWIGTVLGITKLDGNQWTTFNQTNSGLPKNNINTIHIGNNDKKWFGTLGGGLAGLCFSTSDTTKPVVCGGYTAPSGKTTWTKSGTYWDTLQNMAGCDSIIKVNLTIKGHSLDSIKPTACKQYTAPSGNYTWTNSGTYFDTLTNINGCDSIVKVQLTINKPALDSIKPVACNQYTLPSGNRTLKNSGIYFDTLTTARGCDSVVKVDLTINSTTTSTLSKNACGTFSSPSGNHTWASSGTYKDTILNAKGCDSVITINLNVIEPDSSITRDGAILKANANGVSYQWLDCNQGYKPLTGETNKTLKAPAKGSYAVEVSEKGCKDTSACYQVNQNTIRGKVTFNGNPLNRGKVLVWKLINSQYKKVDSLVIQPNHNGQYHLSQLGDGQYLVKASPDTSSALGRNTAPTYLGNTFSWQNADTIDTRKGGMVHSANVALINVQNRSGNGSINGQIVEAGPGKRKGPGDPQGGIEVLALTGKNKVEDYTFSNGNGKYHFDNLALDTYDIKVEMAGFNADLEKVELTQNNQSVDSLNFRIDKKQDTVFAYRFSPGNFNRNFAFYRVYPNPAKSRIYIKVQSKKSENLRLSLINAIGQKVMEKPIQANKGKNQYTLKVDQLTGGVYQLRLTNPKGRKRLVKPVSILGD